MYVRLAFAVAAHLEPEILVIDEVLAVGDVEFQKKCLGKISEVAGTGRTVLFVSHNISAIQALCPRSLYLRYGALIADGATSEIVHRYLSDRKDKIRSAGKNAIKVQDGLMLQGVRCTPNVLISGEALDIDILFRADRPGRLRECLVLIYSTKGLRVSAVDIRESAAIPFRYTAGHIRMNVKIKSVPLVEGDFFIGLFLVTDKAIENLFELAEVSIMERRVQEYSPYSAEHRGLLVMRASSTVSWSETAIDELNVMM